MKVTELLDENGITIISDDNINEVEELILISMENGALTNQEIIDGFTESMENGDPYGVLMLMNNETAINLKHAMRQNGQDDIEVIEGYAMSLLRCAHMFDEGYSIDEIQKHWNMMLADVRKRD